MFTHKSIRASGRSLADFEKPPGLFPAESALLQRVQSGQIHYVNSDPVLKQLNLIRAHSKFKDKDAEKTSPAADDGLWDQGTCPNPNDVKEHLIRADFIRFLMLGGDDRAPVHERGVWICGAYIDGDIFLDGCNSDFPLRLQGCWIVGSLNATNAKTRMLSLEGCRVGGIEADCANVDGAVVLRNGFISQGVVRLFGAKISGPLDCQDGLLLPDAAGDALICSSAEISGYVRLNGAFEAHGEVRFVAANVTGDFICTSGRFKSLDEALKPKGNALSCSSVSVDGAVHLEKCTFEGLVNLDDAQITRGLYCSDSAFNNPQAVALSCDAASINAQVDLTSASFRGGASFYGTHMGVALKCGGARFTDNDGSALICNAVTVKGTVYLNERFSASGAVEFSRAEIDGDFECSGARLRVTDGWALNCSSAVFRGAVRLNYDRPSKRRFVAIGGVTLFAAKIDGDLDCSGGGVKDIDANAFDLRAATIAGDVYLCQSWGAENEPHPRFLAKGSVFLSAANIGGHLNLSGGNFKNKAQSLYAANIKVARDAFICQPKYDDGDVGNRFEAVGPAIFDAAEIGGDLNCEGAAFDSGDEGPARFALSCNSIKVGGSVLLRELVGEKEGTGDRFTSAGGVTFYGAKIHVNFDCSGAVLNNKGGVALDCAEIDVAGCVFLSHSDRGESLKSYGQVLFNGARVGLQFNCIGGEFTNNSPSKNLDSRAEFALTIDNSVIKDTLFLGPDEDELDSKAARINGSLSLQGSVVRELIDYGFVTEDATTQALTVESANGVALKCVMALDGFIYERLGGTSVLSATSRRRWLERQPSDHRADHFRHQPFEQLAKVLRSMGHDADARRIATFEEQDLTRLLGRKRQLGCPLWLVAIALLAAFALFAVSGYWWIAIIIAAVLVWSGAGRWLGRTFLDHFVKYGYQPERAIIYLLAVGMLAGWFFQQSAQSGGFVPKDAREVSNNSACGPNWTVCETHRFHPYVYSFDNMLPIVHLGVSDAWILRSHEINISDPLGLFATTVPGWVAQWVIWAEIIFGWVAGGVMVAVVTGLLRRG